jgi:PPOX class probable FMN-dependent enzyme
MSADRHEIKSEAQLRSVIGEPMEFVRAKIGTSLNGAMKTFVARSPLLFISTIDAARNLDVSPKGDPPGFVEIAGNGDLLIPDRPGNRLAFGFENILRNGRIGLIFIVPNQLETLRVKGSATLHNDPDVLQSMQVCGKPALLFTRVRSEECFFHCGKALIRSHLWQPDEWNGEKRSIAARQLMPGKAPDEAGVRLMEDALERSYRDDLY